MTSITVFHINVVRVWPIVHRLLFGVLVDFVNDESYPIVDAQIVRVRIATHSVHIVSGMVGSGIWYGMIGFVM
jgi:hypothetical protein